MRAHTPSLIELGKRYWLPVYKPRELVLDHGKGSRVWDTEGREYVDFGAGIAVNALGHADPRITSYNVCYTKLLRVCARMDRPDAADWLLHQWGRSETC